MKKSKLNNIEKIELTYEDWFSGVQTTWTLGEIELKNIDREIFIQYISKQTFDKIKENIITDYPLKTSSLLENYKFEYENKTQKSLDKDALKVSTIKAIQLIFGIIEEDELSNSEKMVFNEYYHYLLKQNTHYPLKDDNSYNSIQYIFYKSSCHNLYLSLILNGESNVTIDTFNNYTMITALYQFLIWLKEPQNNLKIKKVNTSLNSIRDINEIKSIKFSNDFNKKQAIVYFIKLNNEILERGMFTDSETFNKFIDSLKSEMLDCSLNYNFNDFYLKKLIIKAFDISMGYFSRKENYGKFDFITNSEQFYYNNTMIKGSNWHIKDIANNTNEYKLYSQMEPLLKSIKGLSEVQIDGILADFNSNSSN